MCGSLFHRRMCVRGVCIGTVIVFANSPGDLGSIPYQRLKKWYMVPPCLTLSIIKYGSQVRGAIKGKA